MYSRDAETSCLPSLLLLLGFSQSALRSRGEQYQAVSHRSTLEALHTAFTDSRDRQCESEVYSSTSTLYGLLVLR